MTASRHSEAEAAKAVVRRNTEQVQGQGDFALFDELFADDFVDHTPSPAPHPTKPAFASSTTDCATRFPTSDPRSIGKPSTATLSPPTRSTTTPTSATFSASPPPARPSNSKRSTPYNVGFGSGVVVSGTGISLHNRGANFVATPGHPNQVRPSKRPYHTIVPGFMIKDGTPVMSFGVMGGTMQPQGQTQIVVRIADYCQNPQAACDGPRFRVVQGMQITVEDGFPVATMNELRRRGHELVTVDDYNQFGSCQAIWRLDDGYLVASDPRRDGSSGRLLSADEFSPRGKLIASTHGHPNPPQSLVPHAEIGPDRLDPAPCHA